jgi:hypothetical protein
MIASNETIWTQHGCASNYNISYMFTRCMLCMEKSIETMGKSIEKKEKSMKTMENSIKTMGKSMNTMEKSTNSANGKF